MQHSAHIPPGRDGLFNFIEAAPWALKYKPGFIVADGDFVHGRIFRKRPSTKLDSGAHPPGSRTVFSSNTGSWSKTKCHKAQLKSELAMFGERFIERRTGPRKERALQFAAEAIKGP